MFTLEALQAAHGDSLILHYGPLTNPRFIVVDGGPRGIFKAIARTAAQGDSRPRAAVPCSRFGC